MATSHNGSAGWRPDARAAIGLVPLVAVARERELDGEALLRAAGIDPAVLRDPTATVADARIHALVGALLERTGDPTLGLAAGRHYNLATFGLLGAVAAVTPSPRAVTQLFIKYQHLTFTSFVFELDDAARRIVFVPQGDLGPLHRFYLDRELSFVLHNARRLWPSSYRQLLKQFAFDYSEPPEAATYRALFHDVVFGAPCAGIGVDFDAEPPPSTVNPLGNAALNRELEALAAMDTSGDVAQRTHRAVSMAVGARQHLPTIDEVAAQLGRSARTLRRELSARGTTFRDILEEVVVTLAQRYLRDPSLSAAAVAERLGYAEASSFARAFRRITGRTLASLRR